MPISEDEDEDEDEEDEEDWGGDQVIRLNPTKSDHGIFKNMNLMQQGKNRRGESAMKFYYRG